MNTTDNKDVRIPQRFILVAVADPAAHPEAVHIAAAAGRPVVDLEGEEVSGAELSRHFPRAAAVLVDTAFAAALDELARGGEIEPRPGVFALAADPGPVPDSRVGDAELPGFVVPAQSPELLTRLGQALNASDSPEVPRSQEARSQTQGRVLAVAGACGGSGASTLAVAVAKRAARASEVVIVDAVLNSGGLDLLLGCEDRPGARWEDVDFSHGDVPGPDLVAALPRTAEGVAVLCGQRTRVTGAAELGARALTHAARALKSQVGLVVIDAPSTGPLFAAGTDVCDLVVLVVPAEVRAVAAATTLCTSLAARRTATRIVLRHRAWSSLSAGDIESLVNTPIVAELATVRGVTKSAELGGLTRLPTALGRAADAVLGELDKAA